MKLLNGKLLFNFASNPEKNGELDRVGPVLLGPLNNWKSSGKPLVPLSHHVSLSKGHFTPVLSKDPFRDFLF